MSVLQDGSYEAWGEAYGDVYDALPATAEVHCPICGSDQLRLVFVGDLESRIASAYFWCAENLHGITVSRTDAPEGAVLLDRRLAWDELNIPEYTIIEPLDDIDARDS